MESIPHKVAGGIFPELLYSSSMVSSPASVWQRDQRLQKATTVVFAAVNERLGLRFGDSWLKPLSCIGLLAWVR